MNKIADKVADLVDEFWFVHYSDEPLHGRMLQFLEWLSVSEPEGEPIKDGGSEEYQRLLYWVLMEKQGQKVPWASAIAQKIEEYLTEQEDEKEIVLRVIKDKFLEGINEDDYPHLNVNDILHWLRSKNE